MPTYGALNLTFLPKKTIDPSDHDLDSEQSQTSSSSSDDEEN